MRKVKNYLVPSYTKIYQTHIVCDLCKVEYPVTTDDFLQGANGRSDCITIKRIQGVNTVPLDGSTIKETSIDMCPSCWETKFTTWLKTQNVDLNDDNIKFICC